METLTGNTFYFDFEVRLMEFLQNTLGAKAISFFSFFSGFGEEMFLILILGYVLYLIFIRKFLYSWQYIEDCTF